MADSLNTPTLPKLHPGLSRRKLMREMAGAGALAATAVPAVAAAKPEITEEERESIVRPLSKLGHAMADGRVDINWARSDDEQTVFIIKLERIEGIEFFAAILAGTVWADRCTFEHIKATLGRKS